MLREAFTEILNAMGFYRRLKRTLKYTRDYVLHNENKKDFCNTPAFHLTAPIGWLNDPNGFIYYKGKYHLFYQYNPFNTHWGPMYWGHAESVDLIKWNNLPVAMAPDTDADKGGVWSGSAIEKDGKLYVMYSGNLHKGQVQNIACSENAVDFIKYEGNPVINGNKLPKGGSKVNFRDPKIWYENGKYYAVIASKLKGKAAILLYESTDIYNWEFLSVLVGFNDTTMRECPDYFTLDGQRVLLLSSKSGESFSIIGEEIDNGLISGNAEKLDYGLDFYAMQTTEVNGRRIMTAWMQSWNRNIPSSKFGYAGMIIIPRELRIIDGSLWIEPVKEIENYRIDKICYNNITVGEKDLELDGICGSSIDMTITTKITDDNDLEINFMKTGNEGVNILILEDLLIFDRGTNNIINKGISKDNGCNMPLHNETKEIRIIIDKFAIEVFAEGKCMSSTAYPEGKDYKITFKSSENAVLDIVKYNLRRE